MSYGERSCSREKAPKNKFGGCDYFNLEKMNCNVDCKYYTSNGEKPDSISEKLKIKRTPSISEMRIIFNKQRS